MSDADAGRPASWTRLVGDYARPAEESLAVWVFVLATLGAAIVATVATGAVAAGPAAGLAAAAVVGAALSYRLRRSTSAIAGVLVTVLSAAVTVGFLARYGGVRSPGELRTPLATLLMGMECLRTFSWRTRRDLRFALAATTALVAVAASMSISISFALPLGAWGLIAGLALAVTYRSEVAGGARANSGRSAAGRRTQLLPIAIALAAALVVAGVAFLLVPAARSSRLLALTSHLPNQTPVANQGGLSNPTLGGADPAQGGADESAPRSSFGYFGFSNRLDTSMRGRPDDTLVMRVRASSPDFWRGQSFDTWDGRNWTIKDERTSIIGGRDAIALAPNPGEPNVPGTEFIQTYFLETPGPNVIFAASRAVQVYIPQRVLFQLGDGTVRTGVELDAGAVYSVVSRRPHSTADRLRAAGDTTLTTPPELTARYTTLPAVPERVRDLAATVTRDETTTYGKVRALEAWMGANTQYSLDIPPLATGADAVEQFLFVDRRGFCEQIASSLVVMLRSQGIAARLAVGYTPGERNPFTGLFEVRARDAHAWAEVYFPGVGWQAFDPTASVPLAGDPQTDAARTGLQRYLERTLGGLLRPLAAVAGIAVLVSLFLAWRRRGPRRARRRDRSWSDLELARLERLGAERGRVREEGETAAEYTAALQRTVMRDPRLTAVAATIEEDAFSPDGAGDDRRAAASALLTAIAAGATDDTDASRSPPPPARRQRG